MKSVLAVAMASVVVFSVPDAFAQMSAYGDWYVGATTDGESGFFAATANDSGGVLGQYCYPKAGSCFWLLASDINCEKGNDYAVLVNTDAGASHHEIYCFAPGKVARYAFKNFEQIDETFRKAATVGIAFPLKSGQFQVSRFSMSGSTRALNALADKVANSPDKRPSTRDSRL